MKGGCPMDRVLGEVDLTDWSFGDLNDILAKVLGEAIAKTLRSQPPKADLFVCEETGSVNVTIELPTFSDR